MLDKNLLCKGASYVHGQYFIFTYVFCKELERACVVELHSNGCNASGVDLIESYVPICVSVFCANVESNKLAVFEPFVGLLI